MLLQSNDKKKILFKIMLLYSGFDFKNNSLNSNLFKKIAYNLT